MNIAQLNERYQSQGLAFHKTDAGLIRVNVKNSWGESEFYLHGAHVTSFVPRDQRPVLWMSRSSMFEQGKPIRGGVPICFPWFGPKAGDPSAPGHGYARLREWELTSVRTGEHGETDVTMKTTIDPFDLSFAVSFGKSLVMTLVVNLPADKQPAEFEEALHTYFAVSDVRHVSIRGLESTGYIDKVDGAKHKPASGQPITFDGECDRVYLDTSSTCLLHDPGWQRTIKVEKLGSQTSVVWNPWIEKAARMPDFGDQEWPEMVCIETANAAKNFVKLMPGQNHTMTATLSVSH